MDKFWMWIAWRLPRRVVYWATVRLWSPTWNAPPSELMRAMDMWERKESASDAVLS